MTRYLTIARDLACITTRCVAGIAVDAALIWMVIR